MGRLLPSYSVGSRRMMLLLEVSVLSLTLVTGFLFVSATAFAVFTRPYITQLTGAPTGPLGEEVLFNDIGGIAVDSRSPGHVWIGNNGTGFIDEFTTPSNAFVAQLVGPTESLAYDDTSEQLIGSESERVAVDNSTKMNHRTAGDVYFASDSGPVTEKKGTVSRVKAKGEPDEFTCLENGLRPKYISSNGDELIGQPSEEWHSHTVPPVEGVAVDSSSGLSASAGYIYVTHITSGNLYEVDQFTSEGCFINAFTEGGAPSESFGKVSGVAVDPRDGDFLVEKVSSSPTGKDAIDEFTSSGGYLGQVLGAGDHLFIGPEGFPDGGIAVSFEGDMYVGVNEEVGGSASRPVVDEFGPGAFYPDVITGKVGGNHVVEGEGRATLEGTVNDEDQELTECYFEYVDATGYKPTESDPYAAGSRAECMEPDAAEVNKGTENQEVHADIVGLQSGTVYNYRLVATTNKNKHGGTRDGENASFAAAASPAVDAVSAGDVSSSSVDFSAGIDPLGVDTTYRFEYVDAAQYDPAASDPYAAGGSAPVSPGDIGSGDSYVSVSVQAGGLLPGTVYYFRVLAKNGVGMTSVDGAPFTTLPASMGGVLPDGRTYEMLTPPNKEDAEDLFGGPANDEGIANHEESTDYDLGYSSEDGDHFLLDTAAAFGSFPTTGEDSYVFSRGETGWTYRSAASPSMGVQTGAAEVFDPFDFSVVGFHDNLGQVGSFAVEDLVGRAGGPYETVATGSGSEDPYLVGASGDLSKVVMESQGHKLPLCKGAQEKLAKELYEASNALYEWSAGELCLSLVDVKSEAEGGGLVSRCGAELGQGYGATAGYTHGAVSADGSRIFFTAPDPEGTDPNGVHLKGTGAEECWEGGRGPTPPQLYVREMGETTVEVSAPEEGVVEGKENPAEPAVYVGAAEDGSKVFFITKTELTKEAVGLGLHDVELYEYNTEPAEGQEKLVRVSRGEPGVTEGGGVEHVVAVSSDGSTVYFEAAGRLTSNAPKGSGPYLYRYDTVTGTTTYVAPSGGYPTLHEPKTTWYGKDVLKNEIEVAGLWTEAEYYTTANGEFLIFPSTQNIAGYDSGGQQELYRYDAENGSIACVSCVPNGSPPSFGARFTRSAVNFNNPAGAAPRPISEHGEYVFFDTLESLVPQDTNGKVDVYEWEADGAGSCTETNGCLSLITTGQDPSDSFFLDSSPDGRDVFFGTHAKLVQADTDEQGDLYDARVDGGFPRPVGAGPCEGDACQNPPSLPIDATPVTLTPSGAGNLLGVSPPETKPGPRPTSVKCKKGYVKKRGRCVRKRKQARKSARRRGVA